MIPETQAKVDGAVAVGALSSQWWLPYMEQASHVYLIVGGVTLVSLRVAIAAVDLVRRWKQKR